MFEWVLRMRKISVALKQFDHWHLFSLFGRDFLFKSFGAEDESLEIAKKLILLLRAKVFCYCLKFSFISIPSVEQ